MTVRIALAGVVPSQNVEENLQNIKEIVQKAKDRGAELILFPETALMRGKEIKAQALGGLEIQALQELCAKESIDLIIGFYEANAEANAEANNAAKPYNSAIYIDSKGQILYHWRKSHLYDAFSYQESSRISAGSALPRAFDTRFGRFGLLICYELRFPELARALALDGASLLIFPTAWAAGPGKEAQFELLARARALENTCFVAAPNLCAPFGTGSGLVIDPFGVLRLRLDSSADLGFFDLDFSLQKKAKELLPCLAQRREELY